MSTTSSRTSYESITRLCGELPDWKIVEIERSGASLKDLEIALAWAADESDVMGEARLPLQGTARRVYEILMTGEEPPE